MKIRTRTSCGDKLSEGACSEREHFFYSGWTSSSASHKLQVGEEVEFQVAVLKRRVWTQSLKQTSHIANDIVGGLGMCTWEGCRENE